MSFLIGKFKGLSIYLNGDDHKDLNSTTLSIPWCMPCHRKGCESFRKMQAATALGSADGETVHVGFFDVVTSVSPDFKVEHQLEGTIPPGHYSLVLTFPFIKANPLYAGKTIAKLRRALSDHESAVAKMAGVQWCDMGPKTTAIKRLDAVKHGGNGTIPPPDSTMDKELFKLAKHILS